VVAATAATARRSSTGGRARRRRYQKVTAIAITTTTRSALEMPAMMSGPCPSRPWLPKLEVTCRRVSASACRPSRYAAPVDSIWSGRSRWYEAMCHVPEGERIAKGISARATSERPSAAPRQAAAEPERWRCHRISTGRRASGISFVSVAAAKSTHISLQRPATAA
jgi:hypothetical protein